MTRPNKLKLSYFLAVIAFAFTLLAALVSCDGCPPDWNVTECQIMRTVRQTETAGAREFRIQLTEAAR